MLTVFAELKNRRIRCRLDHLGMNRAAESGYMASTYSILVHRDDLDRAIAIRDDVLRGSRKS